MAKRDFQDFLSDVENGQFHSDLTTALPELMRKVRETGLVGDLTIKLRVKPRGRQVDIIPSFTVKAPVRKPDPSVFFVDDDGNPSLNDPKQLALKVVTPPAGRGRLRVAGQGAAAGDNDSSDDKKGDN